MVMLSSVTSARTDDSVSSVRLNAPSASPIKTGANKASLFFLIFFSWGKKAEIGSIVNLVVGERWSWKQD
jgi:hypothetical protein